MSDNRKENKKEIDLELKDILLEFLRRWKIIVLFSIIFGLVFGAMRYRKDYAAAHTPAPEVKNTTLEDAYADLDKDQYERVILAVSLKAAIDSKSLYMNESVLMNINAHAEDAVILQYSVEGAEAENIVNSYVNYINSGSIVSDINKEGVHVTEGYLSELIEVLPNQTEDAMKNFTVKVMNSDAESVGLLADAVNDQLTTYAAKLNENNQTHILNLDSRKQVQIIDEALAEKQDAYAQETEDQQNKLASIKADMNANQLRVYLDMEKDIFIWGDDEEEQTETAEVPGEAHLVGDDENGHAAAGQLPDDVQDLLDHFRVQSGGWLVKKHDLRLHGHGPDDGQPLLLAAGELPGILIGLVPQTHPAQQGHGLLFRLILGDLLFQNRGQCHIFQHRQVGEHIEMLEHHADALAVL